MDSTTTTSESNTPNTPNTPTTPTTTVSELRQDVKQKRTRPTAGSKNTDIIDSLWRLHADELAWLAQNKPPVINARDGFFPKVSKMVYQYVYYLFKNWWRCCWGIMVLPSNWLDKISMFCFALLTSLTLGVILLWCIFTNIPLVYSLFRRWSLQYAGGLSFVNAVYPQIFHQLSNEQIQISHSALSQPIPQSNSDSTQPRIFNLDIAKILFQCSAIMYERSSEPLQAALQTTRRALQHALPSQKPTVDSSISKPGQVLQTAVGSATAQRISALLHQNNNEESAMADFAARLGFKYATVSELNSQTSAFCGFFWDPKSNFIIVAFKGTSPTEFVEWTGDFSYEPVQAGDYIRGFGWVHGGFMERIFPQRIKPGATMPYYTVRDAVRQTAANLSQDLPPGTKINVWFTGHSLGTALASLVYARAINEPHEFGEHVVLRDAYVFATPIIADVRSVRAFHNRLNHDPRRMMWRVTNGRDAVATALPDAGDNNALPLGEFNLFSFAHLGMEITLRGAPKMSVVCGNAFPHGTIVHIKSANPPHEEDGAADEHPIEKLHKCERIPILGRLLAHAPALYWYMLECVQLGGCRWQK